MNPRILNIYYEGHKAKLVEQNFMNYVSGIYVKSALESTVGNMFKKQGSKPNEYMENPIDIFGKQKNAEDEVLKQKEVELFFAQQSAMCANWKRMHKK